tara:strand:+ start:552 stop:752 length:201 start_codon:yes stop_codon:yes gene_type:complete
MTNYKSILHKIKNTEKGIIYNNYANEIYYLKRENLGYKFKSNDLIKIYYTDESLAKAINKTTKIGA